MQPELCVGGSSWSLLAHVKTNKLKIVLREQAISVGRQIGHIISYDVGIRL